MAGKVQTPPQDEQFQKLIKSLADIRKRPLLLLNMADVNPLSPILVAKELRNKKITELDVVLHTPGGHIESAYKIVKLLRKHADKVNIVVPAYAKSAGTLICLSGETLVLTTVSELGPLDVQLREHQEGDVDTYKSALNGYKALGQIQAHAVENMDAAVALILHRTRENGMMLKDVIRLAIEFSGSTSGCLYSQLHPKTIAENARALDVGKQYGMRILERYMGWSKEKANPVVHQLVYEYPSHEFVIDREELSELGFDVESPMGDLETILENLGVILLKKEIPSNAQEIKLFDFTNSISGKPKNIRSLAKKDTSPLGNDTPKFSIRSRVKIKK